MLKIFKVRVIPNSSVNKIIEQNNDFLKIKLTAPAHEDKANKALIKFLSSYFKIAKNKIEIITGEKSRDKIIRVYSPIDKKDKSG
jgi:uncharacterized protein (TIGR00251 family)